MMGRQPKVQKKLFYTTFNLEQRIRKNHILRKVKRTIDFDFIYNEVKDTKRELGRVESWLLSL